MKMQKGVVMIKTFSEIFRFYYSLSLPWPDSLVFMFLIIQVWIIFKVQQQDESFYKRLF